MTASARYIDTVSSLVNAVRHEEISQIRQAAEAVANAIQQGRTWHAFGTGHSHMLAEELFYRAGGFAGVNPILEENLMLHLSASQSTNVEREEGLADMILDRQPVQEGDVMLIASNSGRNPVTIEMALAAKARGLTVIAVTSLQHAASAASRHPSGRRLHEIGDIVIDNHGCFGDAAIDIHGLEIKVSPTSTVIGAMIVNAIAAEAIELLTDRGCSPDVFASSNTDSGEKHNEELIRKYKGVIRCL